MTSGNAAEALGVHGKGRIAPGMDADLVLLSEQMDVEMTMCRGNIAFSTH